MKSYITKNLITGKYKSYTVNEGEILPHNTYHEEIVSQLDGSGFIDAFKTNGSVYDAEVKKEHNPYFLNKKSTSNIHKYSIKENSQDPEYDPCKGKYDSEYDMFMHSIKCMKENNNEVVENPCDEIKLTNPFDDVVLNDPEDEEEDEEEINEDIAPIASELKKEEEYFKEMKDKMLWGAPGIYGKTTDFVEMSDNFKYVFQNPYPHIK